jgi:hypothetical protein
VGATGPLCDNDPAAGQRQINSNLYARVDARQDRHMAEWPPPQHEAPDGSEHLAALVVLSTPRRWRQSSHGAVVAR